MKINLNDKKTLTIISSLLVFLVLITGVTYFLNKENDKTTLTILEKQWIESNKEDKIDLAIITDIAMISSNGKGIFFDFINDFQEDTSLTFNTIPAETSEIEPQYSFIKTNNLEEITNEYIKVYEEHYVYLSSKNVTYNNVDELDGLKIGVLAIDAELTASYLEEYSNITFVTYETTIDMLLDYDLNFDEILDNKKIDGLILSQNDYLNRISSFKTSFVNYHLNDLKYNYILTMNDENQKLNSIVRKYYSKWEKTNFADLKNKYSFSIYKKGLDLLDVNIANFKSKRYVYGSVSNFPYESVIGQNMVGINSTIIDNFYNFSGAEFSYKQYDTVDELISAFNEGAVDIMFNNYDSELITSLNDQTTSGFDNEKFVIITGSDYLVVADKLSSIKETVNVVKSSSINKKLTDLGLVTNQLSSPEKLYDNLNSKSLFAIDYNTYEYYKSSKFVDYKIIYEGEPQEHNFAVLSNDDNKLFSSLFDYYLASNNNKETYALGLKYVRSDTNTISRNYIIVTYVIPLSILFLLIAFILPKVRKFRHVKTKIDRDSKLRFIDPLTSLKNREYLKENMIPWQDSKVLPKTLVIVDLNNVKKINDAHGYNEGDRTIIEAASILVNNQIANSDILRIDGNEFLLYLVGYNDKEMSAYVGRLERQMKKLPYNYGAAIGYSIIKDEISTIEDGINEAYLDMRANKEFAKKESENE